MKIGLLGGSFNPIHNAHLRIAGEAQAACLLDRIIFIPTADPPHKLLAGNVSFEHRAAMVALAIAGRPDFEMSTIEAERVGKSYSIDTIREFRERFLPLRVEEPFRRELLLQFFKRDLQRAHALQFHRAHNELILSARLIHRHVAVQQHLLPVCQQFAMQHFLAAE